MKFKIPIVWQSWALVEVDAKSLDEAKQKVMDGSLPYNGEYVDDSFQIDEDGIIEHNLIKQIKSK